LSQRRSKLRLVKAGALLPRCNRGLRTSKPPHSKIRLGAEVGRECEGLLAGSAKSKALQMNADEHR
jgi:hypothetical protein